MEKFELICNLVITLIGVIPTVISLVCLIKNIIANKNWELVVKIARAAMTSVEDYSYDHPEITSEDKLNMAIKAVIAGCTEAGISVDDKLLERLVAYIQELCAWSKTVNVNECETK